MTREEAIRELSIQFVGEYDRQRKAKDMAIKALEQESKKWSLDDAREDFMSDVYNTLDFLPTNDEANRIIDSFDRVISGIKQESRWIPVSERLPEEHEWIGTKEFGTTISDEVYVTFENPKGKRFTKHLSFQNGKVSNFAQREIDALYKGSVPIAWMPLPEPYKADKEGK